MTGQYPSSARAAKQVKTPVKPNPFHFSKPLIPNNQGMEAGDGIEPTHKAFAEPCLTTWLPRRQQQQHNKLIPRSKGNFFFARVWSGRQKSTANGAFPGCPSQRRGRPGTGSVGARGLQQTSQRAGGVFTPRGRRSHRSVRSVANRLKRTGFTEWAGRATLLVCF